MFTRLKSRLMPPRIIAMYPSRPRLPNGALDIIDHAPLSDISLEVHALQFRLLPLRSGAPYDSFVSAHPEHRFADAVLLDALLDTLYPGGTLSRVAAKTYIEDFYGQIFFLGTTFATAAGPTYAFFNFCEVAPVGRYLCPIGNPVRPDVPVYAAVYQE